MLCCTVTFSKLFTTSNFKKHVVSNHPAECASVLEAARGVVYSCAKSALSAILEKNEKARKALSRMFLCMKSTSVDLMHARVMYKVHIFVKGVSFYAIDDPFLCTSLPIIRSDLAPLSAQARESIVYFLCESPS